MDKQEKVELTKEILKLVATMSVITAAAIIAPAAAGAVAKMLQSISESYDEHEQWKYRSHAKLAIKRLEQRGLIVTESKNQKLVVKITQAGRKWLRKREIQQLTIIRPKQWDGLWRVVIFDIPENKREVRNVVRGWLKRLGFARLQQSAWVIPWPCKQQLDDLAAEFELGNQAILLETKTIAKESALRRIFNI